MPGCRRALVVVVYGDRERAARLFLAYDIRAHGIVYLARGGKSAVGAQRWAHLHLRVYGLARLWGLEHLALSTFSFWFRGALGPRRLGYRLVVYGHELAKAVGLELLALVELLVVLGHGGRAPEWGLLVGALEQLLAVLAKEHGNTYHQGKHDNGRYEVGDRLRCAVRVEDLGHAAADHECQEEADDTCKGAATFEQCEYGVVGLAIVVHGYLLNGGLGCAPNPL